MVTMAAMVLRFFQAEPALVLRFVNLALQTFEVLLHPKCRCEGLFGHLQRVLILQ